MTGVFCFGGMVSYIDRLILSVLVDPIRQELHVSDYQVSLLQGAAFAVIYVLAGLALGRLADRYHRLTILLAGSILWCTGVIICGVALGFWGLFAARLLVGIGEATLAPAGVSMIADAVPVGRRATAVGIFMLGTILGGPAAVMFGGLALEVAQAGQFMSVPGLGALSAWRQVLVLIGVLGLSVPLLLLTLREPARTGSILENVSLRAVARGFAAERRILVPLYLGLALFSIGDYGLLSWMPSLLARRFALTPAEFGVLIGTITALGGIGGCIAGGIVTDRVRRLGGLGRTFQLLAVTSLVATLAATLISGPNVAFALAGLGIWNFSSAIAITAGLAALQDVVPNQHRGIGISLVAFCNTLLGLGVGPTLIALITERVFGEPQALGFAMTAITAPAAILAFMLFFRARAAAIREFPTTS
jgi:MFS family permease